ncbi:MAG: hypothetical protein ACRC2H_01160 [Silanimonas sp.]
MSISKHHRITLENMRVELRERLLGGLAAGSEVRERAEKNYQVRQQIEAIEAALEATKEKS